jgi:hypothetical protein
LLQPIYGLGIINDETRNVSVDLLENVDIQEALDLCKKGTFSPEELEAYGQYCQSLSYGLTIAEV